VKKHILCFFTSLLPVSTDHSPAMTPDGDAEEGPKTGTNVQRHGQIAPARRRFTRSRGRHGEVVAVARSAAAI